ncbi:MAG: peptidoglycan DD-metalloendopeptidase family protein [bacterium]|nr:peptidoglycan DD-metalloendopeptidase family protein [bacterium]
MRRSALVCGLLALIAPLVFAQDLSKKADELKKQIEEQESLAKKQLQQQKNLESDLKQRQRRVNQFERTLEIYQYNLDQAQKVIDGAQAEIDGITQRNLERGQIVEQCARVYQALLLQSALQQNGPGLEPRVRREAAARIATKLFESMQEEKPRLAELTQLVEEKTAYQDRIRSFYMPVDQSKQDKETELLSDRSQKLEATKETTEKLNASLQQLRSDLAAAQKQIEAIRKKRQEELARRAKEEAERKAKEEAERKAKEKQLAEAQKAAQQQSKTESPAPQNTPKPLASLPVQPAPAVNSGKPITELRGMLPWPAAGRLVRPFGEFTHPQYKVTMRNTGIDVETASGTAINSAARGEVMFVGEIPGMGRSVIVDHGQDYITIYGNIIPQVSDDQAVNAGQALGRAEDGPGGRSVYHFEIRRAETPLNPLAWLSRPTAN